MSDQLELPLKVLTDREKKTYYAAFPELPFTLKLDEVCFFVFTSESGEETLVIRKREPDRKKEGNGGNPK